MGKKKINSEVNRWDFMTGVALMVEANVNQWPMQHRFQSNRDAVVLCLKMILEKFPQPDDPRRDPEGFAVHSMTSALLSALDESDSAKMSDNKA